ncbi:MAG: M3 family oligoendopeptidase, partial [Anaerolineae bacterium]
AELELMGSTAWSKLFGNFTSQLMVTVPLENGPQELPMSEIRNLAYDPDREVRRRAYEAELATWAAAEVPLAAALNSIKGEVNALAKRRNWDSALDAALFQNHIDRQTLDAMMEAAQESFPDFRRYLQAKARALNLSVLSWFDIFAPLPTQHREWRFEEAADFIVDQFRTYSDRMAGLAQRAFQERWIDAEPRPGKRDGAFCMWIRKDESRILSNFKPAYDGLRTLAHELGHAYHNLNLADRTMLQRDTPMALAETASIFCETIIRHSAVAGSHPDEQIAILEDSLQNACQIVVDITSRYLFERDIFNKRIERELSPQEFKDLILQAQQETYGEGLDPEALHPYMWAVKGHYYSAGRSFYNYPYMFGLLFGLGLYAHYKDDAEAFKLGYDDLLSSTGMEDAASLAARFGIDIRDSAFWRSSLDIIRGDIDRFEALVAAQLGNPRPSS